MTHGMIVEGWALVAWARRQARLRCLRPLYLADQNAHMPVFSALFDIPQPRPILGLFAPRSVSPTLPTLSGPHTPAPLSRSSEGQWSASQAYPWAAA